MTRSTKIRIFRQRAFMLFYPAALPLSRQTLTYTAGIIRRHRVQIGSPGASSSLPSRPSWPWPTCAKARHSPSWAPPGWWCWRTRATTAPGTTSTLPAREEQAGIAEGRQPCPRQATQPRRVRQCPAQNLTHPAKTPLLPLEGRATRQSHPRTSSPRERRMKQCSVSRLAA